MTTAERAKETLRNNDNGKDENKSTAVDILKKAKRPGTMLGLRSGDVKSVIEAYKPLIAQALPKHLTAERIIQVATTLISRTPELAECSVESLIGSVMQCSILGFEPIPALGQAYLIPFNNKKTGKREVQFIIGYKGLVDLARRSDKIQTIYSQCVYSNDDFDYEFGLEPKLIHKPAKGESGEFIFAYAVAKFTNGGFAFEVMSKKDIEKIKKMSPASESKYSPWNGEEIIVDEMRKKTVIRRLAKMLPMSIEFGKQTIADEKTINVDSYDKGEIDLNAIDSADYSVAENNSKKEELFNKNEEV
ncbi:MAG: recombinase RecT [Bacteroidota bacterium]|jgi:recombination protein RecT